MARADLAQLPDESQTSQLQILLKAPLKYRAARSGKILKIRFGSELPETVKAEKDQELSQKEVISSEIKTEDQKQDDQKNLPLPVDKTALKKELSDEKTPQSAPAKVGEPSGAPAGQEREEPKSTAAAESSDVWEKISPDLKARAKKIISVDLKEADLLNIVRLFSRQTGIDIITEEEIEGKVTAIFNNIPVLEAFDLILKNQGLSWYQRGKVIMVCREKPVKVYRLKYVRVADVIDNLRKAASSGADLATNEDSN